MNVHSSFINSSQTLETTQISMRSWMDTYLEMKRKELLIYRSTWLNLRNMLRKNKPDKKSTHSTTPFRWNPRKDRSNLQWKYISSCLGPRVKVRNNWKGTQENFLEWWNILYFGCGDYTTISIYQNPLKYT